jgi:hypothetical protein
MLGSCEVFRDDPDYVGTWQYSGQISADDLIFNTTRTIIFNKNSYEETYIIQRENSQTISAIIGMKGNLKTSHSTMIFELNGLGTCDLDESEVCTGDVVWYSEGSQYWNDNITYFKKTVSGVYEVTGTSLHLTRDLNTDGDYEDTGEDIIFELI